MAKKRKGGKRCHDWHELPGDAPGAWRHTKHGINIRVDGPFLIEHEHGAFKIVRPSTDRFIDNPPSKWGKSV